jgi:hypothetical protein
MLFFLLVLLPLLSEHTQEVREVAHARCVTQHLQQCNGEERNGFFAATVKSSCGLLCECWACSENGIAAMILHWKLLPFFCVFLLRYKLCSMTGSASSKATGVTLKLGDYECPSQYVGAFTPLEFEELVHFFQKVDEVRLQQ